MLRAPIFWSDHTGHFVTFTWRIPPILGAFGAIFTRECLTIRLAGPVSQFVGVS